jgi:hypothetical protein
MGSVHAALAEQKAHGEENCANYYKAKKNSEQLACAQCDFGIA